MITEAIESKVGNLKDLKIGAKTVLKRIRDIPSNMEKASNDLLEESEQKAIADKKKAKALKKKTKKLKKELKKFK